MVARYASRSAKRVGFGAPDPSLTAVRAGRGAGVDRSAGCDRRARCGGGAGKTAQGMRRRGSAGRIAWRSWPVRISRRLDRRRADAAGQASSRCRGWRRPACGLARRWTSLATGEAGIGAVNERMLALLPRPAQALCRARRSIWMPPTWRMPMASVGWPITTRVSGAGAARGGLGRDRHGAGRGSARRRSRPAFARERAVTAAVAVLPAAVRQAPLSMRADAGYFAGDLAVPPRAGRRFAIGANASPPCGAPGRDRRMRLDRRERHAGPGRRVELQTCRLAEGTSMLIRRVALDAATSRPIHGHGAGVHPQRSTATGPGRASQHRLRLQLHPHRSRRVTGTKAVSVEYWYRHRTSTFPRQQTRRRAAPPPPATPRSTPHGCGARY